MNLVVINNKSYKADFRKHLMRAARKAGGDAVHLCCWSDIYLTHNESEIDVFPLSMQPDAITKQVARLIGHRNTLILVGLGLSPFRIPLVRSLKRSLPGSIVFYDVFDYFRYDAHGWLFLKRLIVDLLWRWESDRTLILEKGLARFYPGAAHFDNASHVNPAPGNSAVDPRHLVYIGAIDHRVDFEWLEALANLDIALDIYGYVHEATPEVEDTLRTFVDRHPNVTFLGRYDNDDLAEILGRYRAGVVPYKAGFNMTTHINPDKIYHYLNAGLEVIATAIPQTIRMADYVHVVHATELPVAIDAIRTAPRAPRWISDHYTWYKRWIELQAFAMRLARRFFSRHSLSGISPAYPRLQLGCGTNILPGWFNTDLKPAAGASQLDFSKPFPFPDGCFEAVFCEHTIEHVPKATALSMCREVYRTLKPGGVYRVVTPSLENMAALALAPQSREAVRYLEWYRRWNKNPGATLADTVNAMFYSHEHRHIFTRDELSKLLKDIGFSDLKILNAEEYHHAVFKGVDAHGTVIGKDINALEAFAIEAVKEAA